MTAIRPLNDRIVVKQIAANPALLNSLYRRTHNDMVALYKEAGVEIHNDR